MLLPHDSAVLRLARIDARENLLLCEAIKFDGGVAAIDTVLRRANLAGRVEVGGQVANHFADVLNDKGDLVETVALDAKSYKSLKTKWMRCKVERTPA